MYDSKADTLEHIRKVNSYLISFSTEMLNRASIHDQSKLGEPEKALFDRMTPILKDLTYGTPEYTASLAELKVALDHHYANNSHHPEYYQAGINDMTLFDLVEMFFDWKAATERSTTGDIYKSFEINAKRFGINEQLIQIFINTAKKMKW